MARLTLKDVEARVASLGDRATYEREFLFGLLAASEHTLRSAWLRVFEDVPRVLAVASGLRARSLFRARRREGHSREADDRAPPINAVTIMALTGTPWRVA